ncbi:MAG TPA: zinc-binding dehydrogenase [Chloroflexota bacterium]|nr:zinc-binding dehydrogenase [Chloroflexota bacterium]
MRGVVRSGRESVDVVDVPRPTLEEGTAIVRVLASGICGSDLHGYRENDSREQRPAGHEVSGEVVEVAPRPGEESLVQVGDLVAIDTICLGRACGSCEWCQEGAPFHCQEKRSGADWSGAFAEYIKRDVRGLFRLPPSMSAEEGALVEPLAVAVHALRLADLQPGELVAVIGAGTIGLSVLVAAVAMDAGPVYVLARHPHQVALAKDLGAAGVFDGSPDEAKEAIKAGTGGRGVDVVVETVGGTAPTLDQAWDLVRRRGRVAVLGLFTEPAAEDLGRPLGREVTVHFPVCYGRIGGRHDYEVAIEMIASGRAPIGRLLTHRYSLDEAPEAFAVANDKSSKSVKVQLISGT